jgi:hypothetical protein
MPGKKYSLRSVQAEQLKFDPEKEKGDGDNDKRTNADELAEWSSGRVEWVNRQGEEVPQVVLTARTGTRVANVDDYVIELSEGSFTVMNKDEFERTYQV